MQKIYRLTQNSSFSYIYRKGNSVANQLLVLYKVKANNLKVGISVGKKVGNSVVRSKVKRRISESFRLAIPELDNNCNYVIIAREGCKDATYGEIDAQLRSLLKRSNALLPADKINR